MENVSIWVYLLAIADTANNALFVKAVILLLTAVAFWLASTGTGESIVEERASKLRKAALIFFVCAALMATAATLIPDRSELLNAKDAYETLCTPPRGEK